MRQARFCEFFLIFPTRYSPVLFVTVPATDGLPPVKLHKKTPDFLCNIFLLNRLTFAAVCDKIKTVKGHTLTTKMVRAKPKKRKPQKEGRKANNVTDKRLKHNDT